MIFLYALLMTGTSAREHSAKDHVDVVNNVMLGKTWFGDFKDQMTCPEETKVAGFRIKVGEPNAKDRSGLTGIQLACTDGSVTQPSSVALGVWQKWLYCDGPSVGHTASKFNYVTGFNYRSQSSQGMRIDDLGGTNLKMNCSNGVQLIGQGFDMGTWDRTEYVTCGEGTFLCGSQAELENVQKYDSTGVNRVRFMCCKEYMKVCKDGDPVKCKKWIGSGYCSTSAAYVKEECCVSCGEHLKKLNEYNCTNKMPTMECLLMAKEGKCSLPEYFQWAIHICCTTCKKTENFEKLLKFHNLKFDGQLIVALPDSLLRDARGGL